MRQLSGHDAGFFYTDTTQANANVSLLHLHDQSTAPGGVVRFKSILAHIKRRLSGSVLLRQRLQRVPLGLDHPYSRCRSGPTSPRSTCTGGPT